VFEDVESLKGQLLIAGGGLFDPNFRRTVVLIGEHNEEGALGVVLNRPSPHRVAEAVPPLAAIVGPDDPLFIGGPVQPQSPVVLAEFEHPDLADLPVFGAIGFLTGEALPRSREGIRRARVFAGYAGWGSGQLESEVREDSWILEAALDDDVFTEGPDDLWSSVLRRKGGDYRLLATMPFDPSLN
jgi:putative transcriptional regulator